MPSFFQAIGMAILLRDYETRSQLLLKAVGAWRYSTHASTDAWCCAFAVDDGPIDDSW
jgi:DNA polymerase bacteriophage-type